jgi:predicted DNA-binding transcriptional regulator AlpA
MPNSINAASVEAEFLSRKQAGQFLNISEAWIRKMERAGTGPERIRFGKCVRYSRTALVAFAQARLVRG